MRTDLKLWEVSWYWVLVLSFVVLCWKYNVYPSFAVCTCASLVNWPGFTSVFFFHSLSISLHFLCLLPCPVFSSYLPGVYSLCSRCFLNLVFYFLVSLAALYFLHSAWPLMLALCYLNLLALVSCICKDLTKSCHSVIIISLSQRIHSRVPPLTLQSPCHVLCNSTPPVPSRWSHWNEWRQCPFSVSEQL